jgi:hypothetical protein
MDEIPLVSGGSSAAAYKHRHTEMMTVNDNGIFRGLAAGPARRIYWTGSAFSGMPT